MNVIVELRQYTLRPGARDTLVDLFEREFVTGQEAAGITVGGRFRDLDDADRFVWLRSFPDMAARARALHAFYHGTVWQAHRERANATMLDSDNVLLLRGPGFAALDTAGPVAATICPPWTLRPSPPTSSSTYAPRWLPPGPPHRRYTAPSTRRTLA
ncbi:MULTISPECIES: NIPSNAP family protein [unclassified Streptomyces]|uniref:NIPSNAP family protein n=1 Tax=unclassified Streptomyces TaxID=2593676 RepID=UPI002E2974FC|nr:NIPSNAP family protein [Streptomyces sp. NBC_00190]